MKQQDTIWMYPNQIYVVSGSASANSLFLEDKKCHTIFFDYLNRFVTPMVNILHYKLTATGWATVIQVKSKKEIKDAYFKQRNKSQKADRDKDLTEVRRMISEHFRMFLSNFARQCNAHLNRHGVWVLKKFDKLHVGTNADYTKEFERVCDLQSCNYHQLKRKYQPDKSLYDKEKFLVDVEDVPHVLRSSIGVYERIIKIEKAPVSLKLVKPNSYLPTGRMGSILQAGVLRKMLLKAKNYLNPENPPPKIE